jgi:hypothetical protein
MGLDITAYETATLVAVQPSTEKEIENAYDNNLVPAVAYTDFRRALDGMAGQADTDVFHQGFAGSAWYEVSGHSLHLHWSYGGYMRFRELICEKLGSTFAQVIAGPDTFPFYDLINFADNEGVIGPVAARRIADAFLAHPNLLAGTDYEETYNEAAAAYVLAANTGLVYFG